MDTIIPAVTPLRQRMLEDMRIRKLEPRTQEAYVRAVRKLAAFLHRPPDTATVEDLRNFQLHLVDSGTSPITLNATLTGLRFFFDVTVGRLELMAKMQAVKLPRTLPVVLSPQEVARLIAAARNVKHQAALSVAYGAGLRASEVIGLKVTDVDSQRMTLRVEQGKGRKDRYAMLSPVLLQRLRTWWRIAHAQGRMLPGGWLFPGMNPTDPLTARQLNRAVHAAAEAAGIDKRVSAHSLRHYLPFLTMSCDASASAGVPRICWTRRAEARSITRHSFPGVQTVEATRPLAAREGNELAEHRGVATDRPQVSSEISQIPHRMIGGEAS